MRSRTSAAAPWLPAADPKFGPPDGRESHPRGMLEPDYSVLHVPESSRFEARREQARIGLLLYRRSGEVLVLTHTEVEPELEGQGIGGDLVRASLEYARGEQLKVVPRCPFALAYVRRHSHKYADLIEPDSRSLLER
jgi:uncharacterized protein